MHYFTYHVFEIDQVKLTRMLYEVRMPSFTFNKLINIVFRPIHLLLSEFSIFYRKTVKDTDSLSFYMNNIFRTFKTYEKQPIFSFDHFFYTWFGLS